MPFVRMVKFKPCTVPSSMPSICLVLYSFCANLLHSLIWLIVSFWPPNNLHLLFCYVLSILALTLPVAMAFFCATIRRDSVSLLRFPFFRNVQVFSCEISLVCHSCFSFHFRFLVIFFCWYFCCLYCFWSLLSIFFRVFFMLSSSRCIDASTLSWMLATPLPPFLLGTYSLPTSFLGCKALCIILSFLVLWFMCWSFSLVHS